MTDKPEVSVIVVSFNTKDMTLAAIRSVVDLTKGVSYELIVLDNASSDGSADAIAQEFPDVRLIRSPDNLGFGRANNLAAEAAVGEYVLLLNPDTLVFEDSIAALVDFARERPEAGVWGGRTVFADGSLNPYSCWRELSLWTLLCGALMLSRIFKGSGFFNPEAYGGWLRDDVRPVDIVTGCFLLMKMDQWRRLGGFDPQFFMYAEEADLCYRARLEGARPHLTPDACIVHYGAASEKVFGPKVVRLFAGKVTFMRKHWSPARRRLGLAIYVSHVWLRLTGYGLVGAIAGGRFRETRDAWLHVWRSRGDWMGGYV